MRPWIDVYPLLFETCLARTAEEIRAAQHLRYVVYCREKAYLDPAAFPEEREVDEDDARAAHVLLKFRPTGTPVGSVRLILPPGRFPVERVTGLDLAVQADPRAGGRMGEISRLCLAGGLTPHSDVWRPETDSLGSDARRAIAHAILGLFRGVVALSREHGITHWCGMMGPAVLRGSRRLGVHFEEIGRPVRFFGLKQPILGAVEHVLETMRKERPELWELVVEPV